MTIENTNTAGAALRFINESSNNTVKYVALKGVNTSATGGVVWFSTTTGAGGNDNNTLDNCDIGDGATTPTNGVYAAGSTGTTAQNNSGNTVSNSNIFNFYASGAEAAGVRLDGGNTDWTLTGNSFYQTATRAKVDFTHRAIYVNNTSGNSFAITNNFIGGSQASAGGTAWTTPTVSSSTHYRFVGIQLNVGTTTPSSVQGNIIKNFVWSSFNANILPGAWSGIYVQAGSANVGTLAANTIGSGSGTGSVSVIGVSITTFGIGNAGGGTVAISNNTVGSITTNGFSTTDTVSIVGIQVTAGTNTISNNTVGSTTTANSLNAATSTTLGGQAVSGILSSSSTSATITGNTVANLNNNAVTTGSSTQVRGIVTSAGVNTITGNTVRNLSTTSQNAGTNTLASVLGINQQSSTAGQTVSQNVVHSLSNTTASAAVVVTGIYFQGGAGTGHVIARNLVHSLSVSSTSATSEITGMRFATGIFTAQNNMVRVGIDASGASTAGASIVNGIIDGGGGAGRNHYHNSVYVGGTQTSGAANTFAFTSSGATNTRTFQNNIFVNARTNGGGTGKHYAVQYGGTTVNPTGLTANGNIFFVSSTGGVLGLYNSADRTTMQAWRSATGQDAVSGFADPLFVNPTGNAAAVDLHLQPANLAEANVIAVPSVTDDFDGQARSGLTPTDIGADAGNFTLSSDAIPPAISFPLLSSGTTSNRTLTGWATIADNVSVAGGANAPRLYFKKSTDNDAFVGNTSADNGWKYIAASNASSPYDFTIDYSIINGGSVAPGDTIQYFVVAQDAANNLGSNPAGAGSSANPPVQNVNVKPGAVNSYTISGTTLSGGTKTVCASGCDYTNLTGASGIFAAINGAVVTGNLVINIAGDLIEDGTNGLNQVAANNFPPTVTIQPADGTMKTISGAVANGMIRLNGADYVTIDGRFNNAGRFLTFRNTDTNNPTIALLNDASSNTIRSAVIEGASTSFSNGVLHFSTGATTGNNNNSVADNQIRSLSSVVVPNYLIYAQGTSTSVSNSNNSVAGNELYNFGLPAVAVNTSNDSWMISGNNIYEEAPQPLSLSGIAINADGTNLVTQNLIHGLVTDGSVTTGISMQGSTGTTTVSRNRIYNFPGGSAGNIIQQGIQFNAGTGSTINVVNNQITIIPSAANSQTIRALFDNGGSTDTFNAFYNSVLVGGTASGGNSWASLRNGSVASAHTARDNIFFNNRTGGTGNHFAAGNQSTSGTYTSNYNLFVGTGATAANFFDYGTSGSGTPVSFATWKTSTGGDANSMAGNPDSTYSTSLFVNPAMGDLHINTGAGASTLALVSNAGTPVSGITVDYDNDTRNATTPDIGSDEFGASNTAPSITAAMGVTRQQGSAVSNSPVGTALDAEDAETALVVTVDGGAMATTLGVTVSNLAVNASGQVTANVVASCTAIDASFTLTVTDTFGGTANATLNVTVTANTPPTVGNYPDTLVAPGGSTMVTPTAAPSDNGSIASVTASATPNNFTGTFTGNTSTGALSITNAGPMGGYSITVTVTDNCGASVTRTFMLTVSACGATLSRLRAGFAGQGGTGSFDVTIDTGCPWTAVSNHPFITVTAPKGTVTTSGMVSYNVAQNPGTSARNGTITVAGQSFTVLQGRDFLDVPQTQAFYTEIGKLSAYGITQGCDASNFCPDANLPRAQMAALLSRALGVFNPPAPARQRFADVPPTHPFYAFIEEIAVRQITLGCGGGNYCPSAFVTREQMAAFIIRALHPPGYVPPPPAMQRFDDVKPANPFYAHIEELAVRNITLGCGGGNYCPVLNVTRAQMAVFLVRAFNL